MMSPEIMIQRCNALVIALVGKDTAPRWWRGENRAFDMKTPESVLAENPETVYNYLMQHISGDGS